MFCGQYGTGNRVRRQASDRGEQENEADTIPNLLERRYLDDTRGSQSHICARGESKDNSEGNGGSYCGCRDPKRQNHKASEVAYHNENIVRSEEIR